MTDLIDRLRLHAEDLHCTRGTNVLSTLMSHAADEIERLSTRLEIDPRHKWDGISCRDGTIMLLDEEIERLKANVISEAARGDNYARLHDEIQRQLAESEAALDMYRKQIKAMDAALSKGSETEALTLIRHASMLKPLEKFALKDLEKQLTESQARESALREALHFAHEELRGWYEECTGEDYNSTTINEALALPTDHTALTTLLKAKRMKESAQ